MNSELFTKMVNMRQQANKDIIQHLTDMVNKYPELRFGQILAMLNIIQYKTVNKIGALGAHVIETVDPFHEESVDTLQRVSNKIKQYKDENF